MPNKEEAIKPVTEVKQYYTEYGGLIDLVLYKCPRCGKYIDLDISSRYMDVRGRDLERCSECCQKLDWR